MGIGKKKKIKTPHKKEGLKKKALKNQQKISKKKKIKPPQKKLKIKKRKQWGLAKRKRSNPPKK
ncbi:hypothetical protein HpBT189_13170 [Helicobacter pylori]